MSVENASNPVSNAYGGDAAGNVRGDAADLGTLRNAFADAMRLSLGARDGSSTDTLLDASDEVRDTTADRKHDEDRDRRQGFGEDVSRSAQRKSLDRAEMRDAELQSEYTDRLQRRENIQSDFQAKTKTGEFVSAETVLNVEAPSVERVASIALDPSRGCQPPECFVSEVTLNTPGADTSGSAGAGFQTFAAGVNVVAIQPAPVASGAIRTDMLASLSALTIFSPSGRIGAAKDSKESEEERAASEKKREKKDRSASVSLFSAVSPAAVDPPEERFSAAEPVPGDSDEAEATEQFLSDPFKDSKEGGEDTDSGRGIRLEEAEHRKPEDLSPEWKRHIAEAAEEIKRRLSASRSDISAEKTSSNPTPVAAVPAPGVPEQIDRVRLVQRVAAACRSAANRSGTVRIRIHLDRLGPLSIRVTSESGKLNVRFEATTEQAGRLLREEAETLRETLAERNVVLDRIEVRIARPEPGV